MGLLHSSSAPKMVMIFKVPRGSFQVAGFKTIVHEHLPGNRLTTDNIIPMVPLDAELAVVFVGSGLDGGYSQS